MNSINFDTGYKEYALNDNESKIIRVNTTDYALIDRSKKAIKKIEEISAHIKSLNINTDDAANDMLVSLDKQIREQVNYIFNADVSDTAFGSTNCLSVCSNGNMIFENFVNAVVPVIVKDLQKAFDSQNKRVSKYTSQVKK